MTIVNNHKQFDKHLFFISLATPMIPKFHHFVMTSHGIEVALVTVIGHPQGCSAAPLLLGATSQTSQTSQTSLTLGH